MTAHEVHLDLFKEQMELELGMKDAGVVRFRKMMENLRHTKAEDETTYGQRIIGNYIMKVACRLDRWIAEGQGKAGAHRAAQPYIEALDTKVTAMLGLKCVCSQLLSESARLGRTAVGIARMMEDELRCQHLRAEDKKAYVGICKVANQKGQYKRKVDVLDFLCKLDGRSWQRWPDKDCIHIGMVVINCILDVVNIVEFYDFYDGKKTITCMRPTDNTKKWVHDHVDFMRFMAPVLEPMVVKPLAWKAGELKGGYLTDHIPRRPLVKTRNPNYLEELKYAEMPVVHNSINAAQGTAWRINKHVMLLQGLLKERDSELGDIPRATLYEVPEKPHDIDTNEEARKVYRAKARKIHEENVNLTSRRLSFLQVFHTAEKYSKYKEFYCPAQLDFRGRVYFTPQLNPQGPDWVKGLLEFAEGFPLGEHGLEWLKIHVANLFGVDKVSYSDRVAWVDDNMEMLEAIAEKPWENTQWADADKPFQAFAAARDLVTAYDSGNPEEHISHIPIALDGSCSGLQHLSLAFRDEVGGKAVNLVPSDVPSDIYQIVADHSVEKLQWYLDNGTDEEKELAYWWALSGVTRKVTKRNCMTFPYGSKQRGFSDQILEDTLNPWIKENGEPELNPMKLSNFLAKINFESVQRTVLKAAEAMDWMQQAARMVAKEGRPVCWTTPLGFPVIQAYVKTKEARVETSLAGTRKVLSIREEQLKPDTRKAANSISPNIVHSLDASHLMLTVHNAYEAGIRSFALIHDSFGTHAGKTEEFYDIIRSSFIELYKDDVFADLAEQFKSQISPEKLKDFPELPAKGSLEPEAIMGSLYCFA